MTRGDALDVDEEPVDYELDEDTSLNQSGPGTFEGAVTGRWTVGGGPNGGYLAAILLRGILSSSELPDPITATVHYMARPLVGPCTVAVTTEREGRGHAWYRASLVQEGQARCVALACIGRLREPGPADFQPELPAVPAPEDCLAVNRVGEAPTLWDRLETRAATREDLFYLRSSPGEATTGGWTRLADGRQTDALAVAVFLDCWPPAVFGRTMQPDPIGAPTLEYTVHFRNRPSSSWCYARFESRTLSGGYVDEHGVAWDESGKLVAESRQLARYMGQGAGPAGS